MKLNLGRLNDVSLHLIALTAGLIGAALVYNSQSWGSPPRRKVAHPPGCHACSICTHEAIAARDAFLIRTGSIVPPDSEE